MYVIFIKPKLTISYFMINYFKLSNLYYIPKRTLVNNVHTKQGYIIIITSNLTHNSGSKFLISFQKH